MEGYTRNLRSGHGGHLWILLIVILQMMMTQNLLAQNSNDTRVLPQQGGSVPTNFSPTQVNNLGINQGNNTKNSVSNAISNGQQSANESIVPGTSQNSLNGSPQTSQAVSNNSSLQVDTPIPLKDRSTPATLNKSTGTSSSRGEPSIVPVTILCGIILIVFWGATYFFKQKNPGYSASLPNEALEILGRKFLDPKTSILFLRCGNRILIVGRSETGLNTLGEISDAYEVDILTGLCKAEHARGTALTDSFKTLFMRAQTDEKESKPPKKSEREQPIVKTNQDKAHSQAVEQLMRVMNERKEQIS